MTEDRNPRRRIVIPGWRAVAIAAAVASAGVAALIALHDPAPPASRFRVAPSVQEDAPAPAAHDPLMAELLRCRSLPAGTNDAACREAWEVSRRRFMGESRRYVLPSSGNLTEGR